MFQRIALGCASAAALAGAALAGAGPASADSMISIGDAGYGQFISYGEHLSACDTKSDGYGIRVDWYVQENQANNGWVRDGDGNNGVCGRVDLSIADGHHIMYRVCTTNNGAEVACTGYITDVA